MFNPGGPSFINAQYLLKFYPPFLLSLLFPGGYCLGSRYVRVRCLPMIEDLTLMLLLE
jgi:hypothetical protein